MKAIRKGRAAALAMLVIAASPAPADAAGKPRVKVMLKPAVVAPGAAVEVSGRVAGRLRGSRRAHRVVLAERAGGRWVKRGTGRLTRRQRFSLRWRVPDQALTRTLRVQLVRRGRILAKATRWRLQVVAPPGGPAVPAPAPSPAPAAPAPAPPAPATPEPGPGTEPEPPPFPPDSEPATQVLAPEAVVSAPAAGAAGTLRLAGRAAVTEGDVLASGIGQAAPYGFLFKAMAVRSEGSDTLVDVTPATLLEAIPEASIDETFRFEGADRDASRRFRRRVTCSGGGQVTVEGSADLGSPQVEFEADWGFFSLDTARITASVTASASASASATGTASCTVGPVELLEVKLAPVTFTIGPVPVVLVPEIEVELSGVGEVQAGVATSVDASLTATAGARYENGDLSPIAELRESFDHQRPDPTASARLGATLTSSLEIAAYGVGGPEFAFNAGLDFTADTDATPWWTLDAPISFTAAMDVDVLDVEAGPITVYEHTFRLAEAEAGGPTWTGTITIDSTESHTPAEPDLPRWSRSGHAVVTIDRAPGTSDGHLSERGATIPEYSYSVSHREPGHQAQSPYGECTYTASGSSSAVTSGAVAVEIRGPQGSETLGFGWNEEVSPEHPESNWTATDNAATCSPDYGGIEADDVLYGGLAVCQHNDDHVFYLHNHVPLTGLVRDEDGKRVMRGTVSQPCQSPDGGSATVSFDLVYDD